MIQVKLILTSSLNLFHHVVWCSRINLHVIIIHYGMATYAEAVLATFNIGDWLNNPM